jgi:hypothetical protein
VLALSDGDGDGVFDVYDNCPTVFNPTQDAADGDGDGTPDSCDDLSCGDGRVQTREYCDYADATVDPASGRTLVSYCNGPANRHGLHAAGRGGVSESAVNRTSRGLPTTVFAAPCQPGHGRRAIGRRR